MLVLFRHVRASFRPMRGKTHCKKEGISVHIPVFHAQFLFLLPRENCLAVCCSFDIVNI